MTYEYRATVLKVIDGDTVDVAVDLGFHARLDMRLRLAGIDAPELHAADSAPGKAARDALVGVLPPATLVLIRTEKDRTEKFGRYLALVYPNTGTGYADQSVNEWLDEWLDEWLFEHGFATPYDGGRR